MTNILVTGGVGNIGSRLVEKLLLNKENFVVIADNLLTGNLLNLPTTNKDRWRFVLCDVNKAKSISILKAIYQFDYVFHFAAVVGVKRTQEDPLSVLRDIDGIKNILDMATHMKVKKVFFSSSSEIYGEPVFVPQHEDKTPLNSRVPYAVVKNVGESFCRSYFQEYGLKYTIFRFFNTYGPNQSRDFVIPKFLDAALKNKDITVYGNGSQTRTFTYVDDTIDTCLECLSRGLMDNEVINVGSDKMITILDLAKTIIKLCGSSSSIVFLPPLKDGDMTRRQPDNTKMRFILGRELVSLEEGIKKLLKSFNYVQ